MAEKQDKRAAVAQHVKTLLGKSVDLARLAGLPPVAVICEVLHDDGSPARLPFLELFAEEHRIAEANVAKAAAKIETIGALVGQLTIAAPVTMIAPIKKHATMVQS